MKIKMLMLAGAMMLAVPSIAVAGPDDAPKVAPTVSQLSDLERMELVHRHHVNVMEIEMGALAKKLATTPVKKYGAMLIADHTKADKTVKVIAKARGVKLYDHPVAADGDSDAHAKSMALMATLKTLKGPDFDSAYLAAMVEGHAGEITRVSAALPQVADVKVKSLLEKTLPSLQKHLDGAKELQASATSATVVR